MTDSSIKDPNYKERRKVEELDLISRYHGRFKGIGFAMPLNQLEMYHALKDWIRDNCVTKNIQFPKFIWKPKICDVGCGLGWGSNILSQEADFVWGIDKNEENIRWAKQCFERQKNNTYWTPQLSFDKVDILEESRELMKFDIVAAIEIIEHMEDFQGLLNFLKRLAKKDKSGNLQEPPNGTVFWISTPNRNADEIQKDTPKNEHHVREWTAGEFYQVLIENFKYVTLFNHNLTKTLELDTKETPMMAKAEFPL